MPHVDARRGEIDSSENVLEDSSTDELSLALSNTEPPDLAATPIIVSLRSRSALRLPRRSRVVWWIAGVITALIAAVVVLMVLSGLLP